MYQLYYLNELKGLLSSFIYSYLEQHHPEHIEKCWDIIWFYDLAKNQVLNPERVAFEDEAFLSMMQRVQSIELAIEIYPQVNKLWIFRGWDEVDPNLLNQCQQTLISFKAMAQNLSQQNKVASIVRSLNDQEPTRTLGLSWLWSRMPASPFQWLSTTQVSEDGEVIYHLK